MVVAVPVLHPLSPLLRCSTTTSTTSTKGSTNTNTNTRRMDPAVHTSRMVLMLPLVPAAPTARRSATTRTKTPVQEPLGRTAVAATTRSNRSTRRHRCWIWPTPLKSRAPQPSASTPPTPPPNACSAASPPITHRTIFSREGETAYKLLWHLVTPSIRKSKCLIYFSVAFFLLFTYQTLYYIAQCLFLL